MTSTRILIMFLIFLFISKQTFAAKSELKRKNRVDSINATPYDFLVSNLYKSINMFTQNASEAENIGYSYGAGIAYSLLGKAYYLNGKYEQSTSNYLKAIQILERTNKLEALADTYGEFGYQLKRNDMQRANYFLRAGITISENNHLGFTLAKLYDNYGVIKEMENFLDSAMIYYNKALNIKEAKKDIIGIPYSLNKIAGIYLIKKNYSKAFEFLKKSDSFRWKEVGDFGKTENLIMYGDVYSQMGNLDSAISKYSAGLKLARKVGINYSIRYCYEQLTGLYKQKKNYQKSFENLSQWMVYKDSVLNKEVRLNTAQLELAYETEKKDHDIALSKLELNQKKTQIYLLIAAISIVIIHSIFLYKNQKRKRERDKIEFELNSKLKEAELENKISNEKLRISRELHDNIGSQLTFMISSIDNYVYQEQNKTSSNKLSQISAFGRDTLKELRNAIWALKHGDSELQDLILRVNELTMMINDNNVIKVSVINEISAAFKLSSIQMLDIYRIIQEALQNTIKYASAKEVKIIFCENKSGFDLSVIDDGVGFNINEAKISNGLENMKFRCEESNGKFEIYSSGKGTTIKCSFKLN